MNPVSRLTWQICEFSGYKQGIVGVIDGYTIAQNYFERTNETGPFI
jgi:hypothetical protein